MKISFKDLRALVRHMLSEAEKKDKPKKEPQDAGFSCPKHDKFLMPFFIRIGSSDKSSPGAEALKKTKGVLPPTKEHPKLGIPQLSTPTTKSKVKFYYCPLRDEEGPYGAKGSACDYVVIPKETRQGIEYRAYGDVARELGMIGVPLKKRFTGSEQGKIPQAMMDELERMEAGKYRWKRIKGDWATKTPDQWKKVPMGGKKVYSGDDEHYLSYPYPMSLGKAQGKDEPAYYMSRDKVARALIGLGWNMADPTTKGERKVTPDSMGPARKQAPELKPGWHIDDEDDEDDPWDEDTNPDLNPAGEFDDDEAMPLRWKD